MRLSNLLSFRHSYKADKLKQTTDIPADTVSQAGKGDTAAQAELYRLFSKAMFNICIRMAGNRQQAEDILHDAFILAFRNLGQLKQPEALAGWLKRIVINESIRQCRTTIRWDDWQEHHESAEEASGWWEEISLELVHQEIKNLPDGCRQVFVLYALEDYSHKEIAASLNISESTSKSQYHRSRTLLKDRILKKMHVQNGPV